MACNNGKKGFHSPYGMITDLNITYTGCSTTCNGEEIKPGMRLREILDILIGNCAEGGSATWGDIIGNIEDQTDLVQFVQDNISVANWGSILGDITDQEDLVQFVQENGFGEDKIGSNLHLDGDGKVSLGVDLSEHVPVEEGYVYISRGGEYPPAPDRPYILLTTGVGIDSQGGSMAIDSQGGNVAINSQGGSMAIDSQGGSMAIDSSEGDLLMRHGGGNILSATVNGVGVGKNNSDTDLSLRGRSIHIGPVGSGSSSTEQSVEITAQRLAHINVKRSDNTGELKLSLRGESSLQQTLLRMFVENNHSVLSLSTGSARDSFAIRYENSMPDSPSDNVLPTIGYVRDTLISDAITAAIAPLVQQISDLEDRVQALEDATP